jgi:hypothetical protein
LGFGNLSFYLIYNIFHPFLKTFFALFQAYLKFCCKVQGIRNELFSGECCKVVALEEIKQHFPSGTLFEDYWPFKGSIGAASSQRTLQPGSWVQKPPGVIHPGRFVLTFSFPGLHLNKTLFV